MNDLPIIAKTYDLIRWYVPIVNRLPRKHKFLLGDRIITALYDLLEGLILARYAQEKLPQLKAMNGKVDLLRHQSRLLLDFDEMSTQRYQYVGQLLDAIGNELGGWIKQQSRRREQSRQQEQQCWPAGCVPFGEYSSRSELIGWESIGSKEEESRAAPVTPVAVSENKTGLGSLVSSAERLPNPLNRIVA